MTQRHHQVHPPTGVKPNQAVNKRPEAYRPAEASAATPNSNPSLGPVGLDGLNQRRPEASAVHPLVKALTREGDCDPDDGDDRGDDADLQIS